MKQTRLFKLYLYGIEMIIQCCRPWAKMVFKLYLYGIEICDMSYHNLQISSSNCTFMELKYWYLLINCGTRVQIVPLWN